MPRTWRPEVAQTSQDGRQGGRFLRHSFLIRVSRGQIAAVKPPQSGRLGDIGIQVFVLLRLNSGAPGNSGPAYEGYKWPASRSIDTARLNFV